MKIRIIHISFTMLGCTYLYAYMYIHTYMRTYLNSEIGSIKIFTVPLDFENILTAEELFTIMHVVTM